MNILNSPKHITSLATSSVIVDMQETVYTGRHSDSAMADKVSASEGATQRVMSISHDLFVGDSDLRRLLNSRQTRYNWLIKETYPWQGGLRILEAIKLPAFMAAFENHKAEHQRLLDAVVSTLDDKIAAAAFIRGPLFKRDDYPTADWLRSRFTLSMNITEVPLGDFRVSISQDLADDLKANYEAQAQNYVTEIQQVQVERIKKLMGSLSKTCDLEIVDQPDGTKKVKRGRLHDSTVQQVIDWCDELARFNISENPDLEQIRTDLTLVFDGINIDVLRESDSLRSTVKTEVDRILAKF